MATKRRVTSEDDRGNGSDSIGNDTGPKQEKPKRPLRKLKNLEEGSNSLQWVVFVLVLSLAILGIIYYYNYYQPMGDALSTPGKSTANDKQSTQTKEDKKRSNVNHSNGKSSKSKEKSESKKGKPKNKKPKNNKSPNKVESTSKTNQDSDMEPAETVLPEYVKEKPEHLAVFPKNLRERLLRLPIPPSDADRPFALEIVSGDDLLMRKEYSKALEKFNELLKRLAQSPRSLYGKAMALEMISEQRNNKKVMDNAIDYYRKVSMESFLAPAIIKEASLIRLVTLLSKRERYDQAIAAGIKLYDMDPDNDGYAIQLGLSYIKGGKLTEAKTQLLKVLEKWPDRPIAKANLGYIHYVEGDYKSAVPLLMEGLEKEVGVKKNPRFYIYAGDCLVKLNMYNESLDLYKVAVDLDLFPSLWQRPLAYVEGLTARPWWSISDTGLEDELNSLANQRDTIKSELVPLVNGNQFVSPSSVPDQTVWVLWSEDENDEGNCNVTTQSCDLISNLITDAADVIKEVKVLLFPPSLHIAPHVSTSNTKLRAIIPLVLGGVGSGSLYIRVADNKQVIEDGGVFVMDESFETELWHNHHYQQQSDGGTSLVLVVEFIHPELHFHNDELKR